MRYRSTRDQTPQLDFEHAMLDALARDGGLFVPETWPSLEPGLLREAGTLPFAALSAEVMRPFVGGCVTPENLRQITDAAYRRFRHAATTPLLQLDTNLWLLELYHGPTLAFKDVAMQVLGGLFDHLLARRGERLTIIGATSGDTGSAAIEAIRGRSQARIVILHPHGRTSEVQRRQMTTVDAPNVHNVAIEGSFDDCQALVKAMFNDAGFREQQRLSGVNSINWARVMPQIVYYVAAAAALGGSVERPVSFSVPTGNFGNVYAGYAATRMGLPVRRLLVASNDNDILTRTLNHGDHSLRDTLATTSPSMDIQVSSNFERLLFELYGRDGAAVRSLMHQLQDRRSFELPEAARGAAARTFSAYRADEARVADTMRRVYRQDGLLIDPHTAVGVTAAWDHAQAVPGDAAVPTVVLGTAHPAKFPDAVEAATGVRPPLPDFLADLYDRPERFTVLANDLQTVQDHIRGLPA